MSMTIKDGGSGNVAEVDTNNRLAVDAVSNKKIYSVSEDDGQAYTWTTATYDYDAADTILLVKNTGTGVLHLHKAFLYSDTATLVHMHRPTTTVTTPTGTAVTGTNLNGASTNVAAATAKADETTNVQGTLLGTIIVPASIPVPMDFDDAVLLTTNQSVGFDYVTAGTAAVVTLVGYFEDE